MVPLRPVTRVPWGISPPLLMRAIPLAALQKNSTLAYIMARERHMLPRFNAGEKFSEPAEKIHARSHPRKQGKRLAEKKFYARIQGCARWMPAPIHCGPPRSWQGLTPLLRPSNKNACEPTGYPNKRCRGPVRLASKKSVRVPTYSRA